MKIDTVSVPVERIVNNIFLIRGKKVMIDSDLAELYGVTTKRLNEQVKRNRNRFPEDFAFQLNHKEKEDVVANCDHLTKLKFSHQSPYAFTEHGVAMLSSVLNSPRAVQMNIFIIRAFVKLREVLASNRELAVKIEELERDQKHQNHHINKIYSILGKLMDAPETPPTQIGFSK